MEVDFEDEKLAKTCSSGKELQREYGADNARRIQRRLQQLQAATVLEDLRQAPGRCHELTADRAGQLSLDLKHPLRLVFRPGPLPAPARDDGGLDWRRVERVVVLEVTDTHE